MMDDILELTPEKYLVNKSEYSKILMDPKNWTNIPFVHRQHPNDYTLEELAVKRESRLVRFRGMIQDMWSPELYMENYVLTNTKTKEKHKRSGLYRDKLVIQDDEELEQTDALNTDKGYRKIYRVITLPGQSEWARNVERSVLYQKPTITGCPNNEIKETKLNDSVVHEHDEQVTKKGLDPKMIDREQLKWSPIKERPSHSCIVKHYNDDIQFKVNTIVDIIGFLSMDPSLEINNSELLEFDDNNEMIVKHPSPFIVPRIHALFMFEQDHQNPLCLSIEGECLNWFSSRTNDHQESMAISNELQKYLEPLLFGDRIAMEYLLCNLMSRTYVRHESTGMVAGQFTLNFGNVPSTELPDYTTQFCEILQMLLPASHHFRITIDNLNNTKLLPNGDLDTNTLATGLLQLPGDTHLILDETYLDAGQLNETGLRNLTIIDNVVKSRELHYDYTYYKIDINAEFSLLTFSSPAKGLIPCDFSIPLQVDESSVKQMNEIFKATKYFLTKGNLQRIQTFLTMMKFTNFDMNTSAIERCIANDFEKIRSKGETIDPADFHRYIVLARLLSKAQGYSKLLPENYQRAKFLETERLKRIKEHYPKKKI